MGDLYRARIANPRQRGIFHISYRDFTTYVHELGHLLGLDDLFELPSFRQTRNFMDYTDLPANMFWFWQWENLIKFFEEDNE